MADAVLDSSAVLAVLRDEPGGDQVLELLPRVVVSAVNYAEIVTKLIDFGAPAASAAEAVEKLTLKVAQFDIDTAIDAGLFRASTRAQGLSLGDRACLALAKSRGLPALTADRAWAAVDVGVEIVLIR